MFVVVEGKMAENKLVCYNFQPKTNKRKGVIFQTEFLKISKQVKNDFKSNAADS